MKITNKKQLFRIGPHKITLSRSKDGVVQIEAKNDEEFNMAMGFYHAHDRMMQMMLVRIIASGRLSECLKSSAETLEIDIFMREMSMMREAQKEVEHLSPTAKKFLDDYALGVNDYLKRFSRPFEFKLTGYKPGPWSAADSLVTIKIMSYIGLAQTQQDAEKFIIQSIKNNVDTDKLKSLFSPHLDEMSEEIITLIKKVKLYQTTIPDAVKFLAPLPKMKASNNWMLSPKKSKSGNVIQCNDPHLEVNRLPAVWSEFVAKVGTQNYCGVNMPGIPGMIMGRTNDIGYGFTYGFMDMIDFFLEEVKDQRYQENGEYKDFNGRTETIKRKGKADYTFKVYENDRGILETAPQKSIKDGIYLTRAWSGHKNGAAASIESMSRLGNSKTAAEAQELVKDITISCNWVIGDTDGNICYQQSGILPRRNWSGLYPVEGWDLSKNWKGMHPSDNLAKFSNPESGFIATANNDLNAKGKPLSINLPMGSYRADRISQMLEAKDKHDLHDMKEIQKDLYSLQAEKYLKLFTPFIPDSSTGKLLKNWDCKYGRDSTGATLFEEVYNELLMEVFGKAMFGEEVWNELIQSTGFVVDYYHLFDEILLNSNDKLWFNNKEEVLKTVLEKALSRFTAAQIKPWGETREVSLKNIFFDGSLPGFLGFDKGPFGIEGNRSTIVQGAVYKAHGRKTTFCPSYRLITDLGTNKIETALAGGPSDRRFGPWYCNGLDDWYNFKYKDLYFL